MEKSNGFDTIICKFMVYEIIWKIMVFTRLYGNKVMVCQIMYLENNGF